jgi:ferric-dicitrate binding protein FerR (iron transport regulator)
MKMFIRHVSSDLAAYVDGALPGNAEQCERHLLECPSCRAEFEQIKFGIAMIEHLPSVEAPEAIWTSINAALRAKPRGNRTFRWAFATMALAFAGLAYWVVAHRAGAGWEVAMLDGAPSVGSKPLRENGKIATGEWMETDGSSRARIKVGEIGSVEVEPNTRLRVVTAKPGEHRIALAQGEIRVKISAPPRLFFVDTAAGTAVDLGCEYTLNADSGLLSVTKGWVSFQWKDLESLVPAGASCRTRTAVGPGIPYFDDAPEALKQALDVPLSVVLAEARARDTLTLWHLLARVNPGDREQVYDRIGALTQIPAGISREKALGLDPETLNHLREELAWTW